MVVEYPANGGFYGQPFLRPMIDGLGADLSIASSNAYVTNDHPAT